MAERRSRSVRPSELRRGWAVELSRAMNPTRRRLCSLPNLDDLRHRTMRQYHIFEKGLHRRHELVPAVIPSICEKNV